MKMLSCFLAGCVVSTLIYMPLGTVSEMPTELKALNLVKHYIAGEDNSVFEVLEADALTYDYTESNYKIQYNNHLGNNLYLIQEYEFVIDDYETLEGHTVTSNWYTVDIATGKVESMF